ncbi:M23 family metallopeptidase [Chloroflexus sp.]|uniref:M23 family metallopeptidase n=1 Tax=Chloroflexus sp. TaxID=1904827 RepID=UPI00260A9812|nr:M23 family metallopeptidase [uncultured Chloroflexus sp.]
MATPSVTTVIRIYVEYVASILIWMIFNPYGIAGILRQIHGQLIAIARWLTGRITFEDTMSFTLPFEGAWLVANGGVHRQTSHSWGLVGQRYAYDFVIADSSGKTYEQRPGNPEHYFAFGKPVLAAADGVVHEVRDAIRDYRRAGTGWIDITTPDMRGNYVVIKHAPDRYTLYAHLRSGSIVVKPGDTVVAGQKIGECGHSGHSSEPHLHFQLQDRADFYTAVSLPIRFKHVERTVNGAQECVESGFIARGQTVRQLNSCASGIVENIAFVRPKISDLVFSSLNLVFTYFAYAVVIREVLLLAGRIVATFQNIL